MSRIGGVFEHTVSQSLRAHELEEEDARCGAYGAFAGARALLRDLPAGAWAVVTSNYAHRVAIRFDRLGLPEPRVVIDAAHVERGKPDPEGYLAAAARLGAAPEQCLVCEDGDTGIRAGLDAGITVWAVNSGATSTVADRRYPTLEHAVEDVRAWVAGAIETCADATGRAWLSPSRAKRESGARVGSPGVGGGKRGLLGQA